MDQCPLCHATATQARTSLENYQYKGQTLALQTDYSVCTACGEEFLFPAQIQTNDARIREARKQMDGLLTSDEVRQTRLKLDLTQEEAAKVFGGGVNAFSKYERGEVTQSAAMDKLIRLAAESPSVLQRLKTMAGLDTPSTNTPVISLQAYRLGLANVLLEPTVSAQTVPTLHSVTESFAPDSVEDDFADYLVDAA